MTMLLGLRTSSRSSDYGLAVAVVTYLVPVVATLALAGCTNVCRDTRTPLFVEAISYMTPEEARTCFATALPRYSVGYEAAKPVNTAAEAEVVFRELVAALPDGHTPYFGQPSAEMEWSSIRENAYCFYMFRHKDPKGLLIILRGGKSVLRAPYEHTGFSLRFDAPLRDVGQKEEHPGVVTLLDSLVGEGGHDAAVGLAGYYGRPASMDETIVDSRARAEQVFENLGAVDSKAQRNQLRIGAAAINRQEWSVVKESKKCFYIEKVQGVYDAYIIIVGTNRIISAQGCQWGIRGLSEQEWKVAGRK